MKIITYTADGDVPTGHRHLARIVLPDGTQHPVIFHGAEPQAERAQAWWDAELEKARAAKPRGRPRREQPVRSVVGDVI